MEKIKKIILPVIVVVILLGVAAGLYYINGNTISKDKANKIAIDFINTNLLQGQATATTKEITSQSGVYKIKIDVQGQEYFTYITKDGKILFPQGAEITPAEEDNTQVTKDIPKKEKSQAMLFVMSFCPYGNQAEDAMAPVVDLLGDKADIKLHYVIYSNYNGGGANYCLDKENKYCSMHGIQELNQGVRELCVQKYQSDKLWDFVLQINNACSSGNVDSCWEPIAKTIGIDVAKIKTCQKDEAINLLQEEVALNEKYEVQGSPMLLINEKEFNGARSAEGYKAGICAGFEDEPTECSQSLSSTTSTADGSCE